MTLLAYHNDSKIRAKYLRRVRQHALHDEIVKGQYWEGGKGCAVGCILHSDDHASAEAELGFPTWLMRLIDGIFEALPNSEAKGFPVAFLEAIPKGADLAPVRDQFLAWLMDDAKFGLANTAREQEIKDLADEVSRRLRSGEGVTGPQADELTERLQATRDARVAQAARVARDAWAAQAARDARDARDAQAARDAWAAAQAARDARVARDAWAARDARVARDAWAAAQAARDARDAWDAFVIASRDELLRLLAAAKVQL